MSGRTSEHQETRTESNWGFTERRVGHADRINPNFLVPTLINVMYAFTGIRFPQPLTTAAPVEAIPSSRHTSRPPHCSVVVDVQELDGDAPAYVLFGILAILGTQLLALRFGEHVACQVHVDDSKRSSRSFRQTYIFAVLCQTGGGIQPCAARTVFVTGSLRLTGSCVAIHAASTNPRSFILSVDQ
ncbi:hypothetical protein ARMSODRAFT_982945 [Armillaria solidipes]|uniref:Uncharacterized protein n=1 Tax=Armillaria solidipes TaxID=1076256 RepID=A0A2H3B0L1_9AGAR|nr:hypothetical protein ARMSODRAFT_982945 [Armillaria solidipes]